MTRPELKSVQDGVLYFVARANFTLFSLCYRCFFSICDPFLYILFVSTASFTQLRRQARERREYLYRKSLEDKERTIYERKRKIQSALDGKIKITAGAGVQLGAGWEDPAGNSVAEYEDARALSYM